MLGTVLCLAFAVSPANAQVPPAATGTASPGRVQEQFEDRATIPQMSPQVEVRDLILQQVPPGAEKMRFNLNTIQIDGVSVYTQSDLQPVYADRLGENISLADVYAISTALTNKYRNDGYILTQVIVPPQTIEGGRVKLKVVEGYIDSVAVEGVDDPHAMALIRKYAMHMQSANALNVRELERYLLLISDLPGVEARSILSPAPARTGAANLRIIVTRDPYDALLAVDNFGTRYLGPVQGSAFGALNSYFGNNERISGQVVVAPDSDEIELGYLAVTYEQPVGHWGTMVEVFASHTDTEPGHNLEQFNVEGRSQFFRAKVEHPFIRSRSRNVYGHVAFDWRDVESKNDLEPTRRDRIRTARVGGRVEFLDTLLGVAITSIGMEVSQGLDLLGSSDEDDLRLTRPNADPTATKIAGEAQRLQRISSSVNLLLAAKGQVASNALLSSEEFGVGGVNYGRGFDASEIIGDDGVAGKVELQWNKPYPWDLVQDYQVYGFFDAGRIWNKDATTSSLKTDTITSAGLGLRADFMADTEAGLALAFPLNRDVETQGDDDPRLYFNLSRKF